MKSSDLERAFAYHWRILGGPPLTREHRFALPRRFRLDFAHLPTKVAIECQGGIWTRGRHTRGRGYLLDIQKRNLAAQMGWAWFEVASDMLAKDPVGTIRPIIETIERRTAEQRRKQEGPSE